MIQDKPIVPLSEAELDAMRARADYWKMRHTESGVEGQLARDNLRLAAEVIALRKALRAAEDLIARAAPVSIARSEMLMWAKSWEIAAVDTLAELRALLPLEPS